MRLAHVVIALLLATPASAAPITLGIWREVTVSLPSDDGPLHFHDLELLYSPETGPVGFGYDTLPTVTRLAGAGTLLNVANAIQYVGPGGPANSWQGTEMRLFHRDLPGWTVEYYLVVRWQATFRWEEPLTLAQCLADPDWCELRPEVEIPRTPEGGAPVPEPGVVGLVGVGLVGIWRRRRR